MHKTLQPPRCILATSELTVVLLRKLIWNLPFKSLFFSVFILYVEHGFFLCCRLYIIKKSTLKSSNISFRSTKHLRSNTNIYGVTEYMQHNDEKKSSSSSHFRSLSQRMPLCFINKQLMGFLIDEMIN